MKIKLPNNLLIVVSLSILLILAILAIPDSWVRIVLGLPFLLFFPGFVLIEALFVRRNVEFLQAINNEQDTITQKNPSDKETKDQKIAAGDEETRNDEIKKGGMDGIERVALSFGMSIAVTALIGLGLNYTPWGIRLLPVLYSNAAFIVILSAVALIRQYQTNGRWDWLRRYMLKMPGWEGSHLNKTLTVILAVAIVGAIGTLIYTVASPKVGEKFSEFYILGLNGKAEDYPAEFDMTNGRVTTVKYGNGIQTRASQYGEVTLGIVNQAQQQTGYTVKIQVDGQPVKIIYNGQSVDQLSGIILQQGEKLEQKVGFAPLHTGDNQKVEFLFYKDAGIEVHNSLHLWVHVKGG